MTTDSHSPVVLVTAPHEIEAAAIVTALDGYGIESFTTGGYTAGFRAEAPGDIQVRVKQQDLERAKRALAEIRQTQTAIDWSNIDVGESEEPLS
jgi:hypothetical protein